MKVTPDRYLTYRYAGASGDFNPIHLDDEFARSVGLPGRILISFSGLVVATLSVTGVVIWSKKRKARVLRRRREAGAPRGAAPAPQPAE